MIVFVRFMSCLSAHNKVNLDKMGFKAVSGKHIFDDFNKSPTECFLAEK